MLDQDPLANEFGAANSGEPSSSVLLSYLGILRRRIWIVLTVLMIAGLAGVIKSFRTQAVYRAKAQILVQRDAGIFADTGYSRDFEFSGDEFFSTQMDLLKSRAVLELALQDPTLKKHYEKSIAASTSFAAEIADTLRAAMNLPPKPRKEPWQLLRESIYISKHEDSSFLFVSAESSSPSRGAHMANVVSDALRQYHRQRREDMMGQEWSLLSREKEKAQNDLIKAEQALQSFRETSASLILNKDNTDDQPMIARLNAIGDELTRTQLARIDLSTEIGIMKSALDSDASASGIENRRLFTIPDIQENTLLSRARQDLADAEKELHLLHDTYGSAHPLLRAANTNVFHLRQIFKEALGDILASHENKLTALNEQEDELQTQYNGQRKVVVESAKDKFDFNRLNKEVERNMRLYNTIVDKMRDLDVNAGGVRISVDIVEKASPPTERANASRMQITFYALCLGLFLGAGLAFLVENLDDSIKTPEDLTERLDVPFLGFIPSVVSEEQEQKKSAAPRDLEHIKEFTRRLVQRIRLNFNDLSSIDLDKPEDIAARKHAGTITITEPLSSIAEAYRSVRANLFYSSPADEIKMIAITSSRPQEGKTTTSANLALSVSQTGKRILLVDADLHRPSVHRTLGMEQGTGLTDILIGECHWKDACRKLTVNNTTIDSLDIITAGPTSPNPSELLNSKTMREFLLEAKNEYDWVFIDTPPVLFVSDSSILSVICDGVLLVIKSGESTRSLLARTMERLDAVNAKIIGSVLNNVQVSRVGRYYSTYYNVGYSRYAKDYQRTYYAREGADEVAAPAPAKPEPAGTETSTGEDLETRKKLAIAEKALQDEKLRHNALRSDVDQQKQAHAARITELAQQIETGKQTIASLKQEIAAREKPEEHEPKVSAETKDLDDLNTIISDLNANLEQTRDALQTRTEEVETLQQQIKNAETQAAEQQKVFNETRAAHDRALADSEDKTVQAEKLVSELRQELKAEQQRAFLEQSTEIEDLEIKLEAAEKALEREKASREREAAEQRARQTALKSELEQAKNTATEQAAKIIAISQESQNLREAAETANALNEQAIAANRDNETLKAKLSELEKELENAKTSRLEANATDAIPMPDAVPTAAAEAFAVSPAPPQPADMPATGKPDTQLSRDELQVMAQKEMAAGNFSRARDLFSDLLGINAEDPSTWEMLIMSQWHARDTEGMSATVSRLENSGKPAYLASLAKGQLAALRNDATTGRAHLEETFAANPGSAVVQEALTRLDFMQRRLDLAEEHLRRFVRHFPKKPYGHFGMATLHIESANLKKAEKCLRKSLKFGRSAETLNNLAWILNQRGETAFAEQCAREALSLNEKLPQLWDTLGAVLLKSNRLPDAKAAFEAALNIDPESVDSLLNLADCASLLEDRDTLSEAGKKLETPTRPLTASEQNRLREINNRINRS